MPHGVCEKPEEGRHKSTFSQWLPYPHRIDRGPGWSPCEANPKGLGLRHVLESGGRALAGYGAHHGTLTTAGAGLGLHCRPSCLPGLHQLSFRRRQSTGCLLLPILALCTQSMAQKGASHVVTCKDITGTSNRFVAPIPKLERRFEDPHFTWTEVDPV